jgi:CheY-like chemotaxis protein
MKRTILLADDSPTIRRLVTQTFAGGKLNIVEASNGEAAIKALDEVRPDIVLADIYMPGKNGYEVCAFVRKHETLHDIPVVLLVGAFDAFDENIARQSGATANITKPFEPGALIDLVKSLLPPEKEDEEADRELRSTSRPEAPPVSVPRPVETAAAAAAIPAESEDLLGLETIFKEEPVPEKSPTMISEEDIERIVDRVIQRLSAPVIENIAWDIVPDIAERVIREELKIIDES